MCNTFQGVHVCSVPASPITSVKCHLTVLNETSLRKVVPVCVCVPVAQLMLLIVVYVCLMNWQMVPKTILHFSGQLYSTNASLQESVPSCSGITDP